MWDWSFVVYLYHKTPNMLKKLIIRYKLFLRRINRFTSMESELSKVNTSQCTFICRKLIHDKNSELLIAPISEKMYIKNQELGIFITKDGHEVTITNHTYSYFIKLRANQSEKLNNFFFKEMEIRAKIMERELEGQIKHSLDKIFTTIISYNSETVV